MLVEGSHVCLHVSPYAARVPRVDLRHKGRTIIPFKSWRVSCCPFVVAVQLFQVKTASRETEGRGRREPRGIEQKRGKKREALSLFSIENKCTDVTRISIRLFQIVRVRTCDEEERRCLVLVSSLIDRFGLGKGRRVIFLHALHQNDTCIICTRSDCTFFATREDKASTCHVRIFIRIFLSLSLSL